MIGSTTLIRLQKIDENNKCKSGTNETSIIYIIFYFHDKISQKIKYQRN